MLQRFLNSPWLLQSYLNSCSSSLLSLSRSWSCLRSRFSVFFSASLLYLNSLVSAQLSSSRVYLNLPDTFGALKITLM